MAKVTLGATKGMWKIHFSTYTTGNSIFAECERICRVSSIAHSAKTEFAECGTRKNKTLGKDLCVECLAVGKDRHSANIVFAECFPLSKMLHSAKIARG
jgi:hypothetical protein